MQLRADEIHQHLFLSCDFRVVRAAFQRCGIDISARSLHALLDFIMSTDSTTPQGSVMSLVIANVTWQLWKERCDRMHRKHFRPKELILKHIIMEVSASHGFTIEKPGIRQL